eukprot:m.266760 g.266760  ORF g.266760 m.266760 type:complete len:84 (+) comp19279_c1_seq7:1157-1408(+)
MQRRCGQSAFFLCFFFSIALIATTCTFLSEQLASKLHNKWVEKFATTSAWQLEQSGLTWDDVWLAEQERQDLAVSDSSKSTDV